MNKLVPLQFGSLRLAEMVQPIGEQSPMGLLWRFMAASPAYTMFTGFAEVLAASLLLFRRTAMLGAFLCAGVMANVVALNFCYDVPVKLFSSRLLLMSLFLLAPDVRRLCHFFILQDRPSLHGSSLVVSSRGALKCPELFLIFKSRLLSQKSSERWCDRVITHSVQAEEIVSGGEKQFLAMRLVKLELEISR
jgi:hypothetical protein